MTRRDWTGRLKALAARMAAACAILLTVTPTSHAQPETYGPGLPMWVVRDDDSTIYLTGTVHVLRDEHHWRSPKLDAAFEQASELYLELAEIADEAALNAAIAELMKTYAAYDGKPLSSILNEDENRQLSQILAEAGAPPDVMDMLDRMQPWVTLHTIGREYFTGGIYKSENGIDNVLAQMANARGKPVHGMESLETQIKLSAQGTVDQQIAQIRATLRMPPGARAKALQMADLAFGSWVRGEVHLAEAMIVYQTMTAAMTGMTLDPLFKDRNEAWAALIEEKLKGSGVTFIAVGAGHLLGPDSLQERLKLRGITSERY